MRKESVSPSLKYFLLLDLQPPLWCEVELGQGLVHPHIYSVLLLERYTGAVAFLLYDLLPHQFQPKIALAISHCKLTAPVFQPT